VDAQLQGHIETTKLRVYNAVVLVDEEEDIDIRVQDYIAKLACLQVIPAGVDYWMNQFQSVAVTAGTNEVTSYPNRVEALWKVYERILIETKQDQAEIDAIIGVSKTRPRSSVPEFPPV
jgi:hypothetical protein